MTPPVALNKKKSIWETSVPPVTCEGVQRGYSTLDCVRGDTNMSAALSSKGRHTNKFSRDLRFLSVQISEFSRFLQSISSFFLPSVVDKISRFFFSRFCACTSLDRTQGRA